MINPYSVLGISVGASKDEVKRAYRKLARKHHPDNGGNREEYERVCKAFEIINKAPKVPIIKKKHLCHVTLFTYAVVQ